ncbi:MAG: hypothetical protein ACLUFI_14655 [Oscillospiraceae bacterium]
MKLERIGAQHPLFDASFSLYESSFPPNERRTRADHLLALQDTDFLPLGAVEDDRLLADVFVWQTEDFVYLEHFAVAAVAARAGDRQPDPPGAAAGGEAFHPRDRTAGGRAHPAAARPFTSAMGCRRSRMTMSSCRFRAADRSSRWSSWLIGRSPRRSAGRFSGICWTRVVKYTQYGK